MRILGVDVGLSGAAAIFGHRGGPSNFPGLLSCIDLPTTGEGPARRIDCRALAAWLAEWRPEHAYIENATAMPAIPDQFGNRRGMGAGTMARYMRAVGQTEACVDLSGADIKLVMPAVWKRRFGLVGPDKGNSLDVARDFFPAEAATILKRQKDHNRAEACLIAVYGAERIGIINLSATE